MDKKPINHSQLQAFPDYDNTKLFIELLELLAPQGFTDSSWRNDEWPSMTNDKYVIHVSYSAESEYNDFDEVSIGIIHLDEEGGATEKSECFETVEGLTNYMGEQFRKAKFQIDGGDIFEGWTQGKHWNGWAMPYFEESELKEKIIPAMSHHGWKLMQSDCDEYFVYVGPDEVSVFESCVALPMKVWPLGAGSWCWEEVTEEEE